MELWVMKEIGSIVELATGRGLDNVGYVDYGIDNKGW